LPRRRGDLRLRLRPARRRHVPHVHRQQNHEETHEQHRVVGEGNQPLRRAALLVLTAVIAPAAVAAPVAGVTAAAASMPVVLVRFVAHGLPRPSSAASRYAAALNRSRSLYGMNAAILSITVRGLSPCCS